VHRLEEIAKVYAERLEKENIFTVEHFLKALNEDPCNLAKVNSTLFYQISNIFFHNSQSVYLHNIIAIPLYLDSQGKHGTQALEEDDKAR
jgi:hypothetical protein